MAEPRLRRKLAAILSADVAGYSRLMQDDEAATVETLTKYRSVFSSLVSDHEGRIVDSAGDNVLAEFASPVEAVRCAVEIQRELSRENLQLAKNREMCFRIGINLGDVLGREDGTIYGDGVNVAARLESLAQPGGIAVSNTVFDHAENKLPVQFEYAGEHAVKNMAKPVRVFRVISDALPAASSGTDRPLPLPDKPSIAVLPFDNLSGNPEDDYFADGISEDLITALSRIRWMFVTARNSSFAYKGQSPDVKQVGQDLGVRYVVEGSVRKDSNRVRINAQLIDASSRNHIWAERYDRELIDLFDLQDELTETLVGTLQTEVGEFERERAHRKPPGNLDAWESYQRGLWFMWRLGGEDLDQALRLFQRAVELDPGFAQPLAASAYTLFLEILFTEVESPRITLDRAMECAKKAVALDDKEAFGYFSIGRVQASRGEYDAAIEALQTAIDLNPSLAIAHFALGQTLGFFMGRAEESISELSTAIRLSPRDPLVWAFYSSRGWVRLLAGDSETALNDVRRASRYPTAGFWPQAHLASAYGLLGRREEARIARENLLELKPNFDPVAALAVYAPLNPESLQPIFKPWFEGLRKAGIEFDARDRS